jgi:maleylacetate reductase
MELWTHDLLAGRVVFGPGSVEQVADECTRLGGRRVIVIASPSARRAGERIIADLGPAAAGLLREVRQHVPADLVERTVTAVDAARGDLVVSVGGGSAIGLGKAVALKLDVPVVAVPTTYAGSEMTPIYGITDQGEKRTGRDERVLPRCVVYDPVLTVALPASVTAASGMNAMAHCVEALWVPAGDPITAVFAVEGIRLLGRGLPEAVTKPEDLVARSDCLLGACLAGRALGAVGTGLHHKICHVLGGRFDLPHAEVHAVVLPHVTFFNASAVPTVVAAIERVLPGQGTAAARLQVLGRRLGCPASLAELGMPKDGVDEAADLVGRAMPANPRAIGIDGVHDILEAAWEGRYV